MSNLDDYEYNIETDYKSVRGYTVLHWTTEPPTKEGLYRAIKKSSGRAEWVYLGDYFGVGEDAYWDINDGVYCMGIDIRYERAIFTHWLGPFPVPELPKE